MLKLHRNQNTQQENEFQQKSFVSYSGTVNLLDKAK